VPCRRVSRCGVWCAMPCSPRGIRRSNLAVMNMFRQLAGGDHRSGQRPQPRGLHAAADRPQPNPRRRPAQRRGCIGESASIAAAARTATRAAGIARFSRAGQTFKGGRLSARGMAARSVGCVASNKSATGQCAQSGGLGIAVGGAALHRPPSCASRETRVDWPVRVLWSCDSGGYGYSVC